MNVYLDNQLYYYGDCTRTILSIFFSLGYQAFQGLLLSRIQFDFPKKPIAHAGVCLWIHALWNFSVLNYCDVSWFIIFCEDAWLTNSSLKIRRSTKLLWLGKLCGSEIFKISVGRRYNTSQHLKQFRECVSPKKKKEEEGDKKFLQKCCDICKCQQYSFNIHKPYKALNLDGKKIVAPRLSCHYFKKCLKTALNTHYFFPLKHFSYCLLRISLLFLYSDTYRIHNYVLNSNFWVTSTALRSPILLASLVELRYGMVYIFHIFVWDFAQNSIQLQQKLAVACIRIKVCRAQAKNTDFLK